MGLSNQERTSKTYYAIRAIVEKADELRKVEYAEDYKRLLNCIDDLWHHCLGKQHNGLHWFCGSSATNEFSDESESPWHVAIEHFCQRAYNNQLREDAPVRTLYLDEIEKEFNPFDDMLDVPGLLRTWRYAGEALVFEIFAWAEQMAYALRRYNDNYLKNRDALSKTLSTIYGECFHHFQASDIYAKAYVANQVALLLYGDIYKRDEITAFLFDDSFQHDFASTAKHLQLPQLVTHHVALETAKHKDEKEKGTLLNQRLLTTLDFAKGIYKYEHVAEKFCKHFKGKLLALAKTTIEANKPKFEAAKQAREEEDGERYKKYPLSIYGQYFFDDDKIGLPDSSLKKQPKSVKARRKTFTQKKRLAKKAKK